ncbi:unnamed protein product [Caenorhabditis brenneri]
MDGRRNPQPRLERWNMSTSFGDLFQLFHEYDGEVPESKDSNEDWSILTPLVVPIKDSNEDWSILTPLVVPIKNEKKLSVIHKDLEEKKENLYSQAPDSIGRRMEARKIFNSILFFSKTLINIMNIMNFCYCSSQCNIRISKAKKPLSLIANATTKCVEFGKMELARVQVMGIVYNVHADILIVEKEEDECILCRKVFNSKSRLYLMPSPIIPGHMVEVYGKIRLLEDETPLCRCSKLSRQCVGCRNYSTKRIHRLFQEEPIAKFRREEDRFPMKFLEQSSSIFDKYHVKNKCVACVTIAAIKYQDKPRSCGTCTCFSSKTIKAHVSSCEA